MLVIVEARNDVVVVDEVTEVESEKLVISQELSQKSTIVDKSVKKDIGKGKLLNPILKTIQQPPFFSSKSKEKIRVREISKFYIDVERTIC